MPSVQIKNLSEQTHAVLLRRAVDEASHPTIDEVIERVKDRAGGSLSFADAVQGLREDRDHP